MNNDMTTALVVDWCAKFRAEQDAHARTRKRLLVFESAYSRLVNDHVRLKFDHNIYHEEEGESRLSDAEHLHQYDGFRGI